MEWVAIVVPVAAIAILGLIAFGLKGMLSNAERRLSRLEDNVSAIQGEILRDCVSKEDWVRGEASSGQKLDRLTEMVAELRGQLDVSNVIGQAIAALQRRDDNHA